MKTRNRQYEEYYTKECKHKFPLSKKEFNDKMANDVEFFKKWYRPDENLVPTPVSKKNWKESIQKEVKDFMNKFRLHEKV